MAQPIDPRARKAAIAIVACLVPMFWGVITKQWFSSPHGNVGLAGVETCHLLCELKMWTDLHVPTEISVLGMGGFLAGLNAFGFGCHAFAMILKGKPEKVKYKTIAWLSVFTAVASLGFMLRMKLGAGGSALRLEYPGFLALGGSIALVVVLYKFVAPLRSNT
jgi:hypothetical protein